MNDDSQPETDREKRVLGLVPPPRHVPWSVRQRVLFGGFMNQFGWAFFGFGLVFVWAFAPAADLTSLIHLRGALETADGLVTRSEKTNYSEGGGRHSKGTPIFANHYAFEVGTVKYEGTSYATGKKLAVGQNVTIEFPSGKPSVSRIRGMRANIYPAWILPLVILFPLIGFCFLVAGIKKGLRAAHLLTHGKVALGTLKSKEATNSEINKQRVYKFTFEFTTDDGEQCEAVARSHLTEQLEDEDREPLLYDPMWPTTAVMLDNLPGLPKIDEFGMLLPADLMGTLMVLGLPGLTVVGHGIYIFVRFVAA